MGFLCVVLDGPTIPAMRADIELDTKDWDILARLQRDALVSNKELAAAVGNDAVVTVSETLYV